MSSPFKGVSARKECSRNVSESKQFDHPTQDDPKMSDYAIGVVQRSPKH